MRLGIYTSQPFSVERSEARKRLQTWQREAARRTASLPAQNIIQATHNGVACLNIVILHLNSPICNYLRFIKPSDAPS